MSNPSLLFGTLFTLASGGIYLYIARQLGRRKVASDDPRLAWQLFVVWWYGFAGTTLIGGVQNLFALLGNLSLALFATLAQINLLLISVALFGLMYYLLFLFIGRRRLLEPLGITYILFYMLLLYYTNWRQPIGVLTDRWNASLDYAQPAAGPFLIVILLFLVGPQILGSFAYFTLFFRLKDRTQRYRIALVSWSLIIWFGISIFASASGLSLLDWWQIVSRIIGLTASLTILLAYQPFNWIKQRLGVTSINEETVA